MKKWGQMTWLLLGVLYVGCAANRPLSADSASTEFKGWKSELGVKKEDVENVDKYKLDTSKTLQICLKVPSASSYKTECMTTITLSNFLNDLPILKAKQICQKQKQGEYYITPEPSQTAIDYVIKCKGSTATSLLMSLKSLCESKYPQLKNDQEKFCSSSNGNSDLQQLVSENSTLKKEKEVLAKENQELKNKNQELKLELEQAKSGMTKNCEITNHRKNHITIAIKNYSLRFVEVQSTYRSGMKKGIRIALTKQLATDFHQQAMQLSPNSLTMQPNIFKAVSQNAMRKIIPKFWIQERTINSQLYSKIIKNGSANKVSYEDAMQVIETLNDWCDGKAKFKLPEEKQFVYLARMAYNPIREGLKACQDVKGKVALNRVKQLFAHKWQLTSSYCSDFDNDNTCSEEQSRIKKGGSIESKYAAECMPEYRAESISDMREPNTTFRLVLKLIK